jgi:hypothetical protein
VQPRRRRSYILAIHSKERGGAREATAIGNGFELDRVSATVGVVHMMRIAGCFAQPQKRANRQDTSDVRL